MLRRPNWPVQESRAVIACLLAALLLTVWHHAAAKRQHVSLPERVTRSALYPVQSALSTACVAVGDLWQGVRQAKTSREDIERLRAQRDQLLAENLSLRTYYLEYKRLVEQIGLPPLDPLNAIPARVISSSGTSGPSRRITVEVSRGRSLLEGAPVRTVTGLVGRVASVQGQRAVVVLLVDASSAVSARIMRTGDVAIVRGPSEIDPDAQTLRLVYLPKEADARIGDVVVTSGRVGVYPPNLPIGKITSIRRSLSSDVSRAAVIEPFADFRRLEYVLVVQG